MIKEYYKIAPVYLKERGSLVMGTEHFISSTSEDKRLIYRMARARINEYFPKDNYKAILIEKLNDISGKYEYFAMIQNARYMVEQKC